MEENKKQELKLEIAYSLMTSLLISVLIFGLLACVNFWEAFRLSFYTAFLISIKEPLSVDVFLSRAIPLCVIVFIGGFVGIMYAIKNDKKVKKEQNNE